MAPLPLPKALEPVLSVPSASSVASAPPVPSATSGPSASNSSGQNVNDPSLVAKKRVKKQLTAPQWAQLAGVMKGVDLQMRQMAKEWGVDPASLFKPFCGLPKLARVDNPYNLFQKVGHLMHADEIDELGQFMHQRSSVSIANLNNSWP